MPLSNRLTAREYAFLGLGILFWAGFVILLGKDTSWDFRNYLSSTVGSEAWNSRDLKSRPH